MASASNDLLTIADALGYREFGVSGWSEGGPWPLAAAAYLDPARLRHVTSIAGGNYGTFGDMWAAKFMDKIDTWVAILPCTTGSRSISCTKSSVSMPSTSVGPTSGP